MSDWTKTSEQLPAASATHKDWSELVEIVILQGFKTQLRDLGRYHFPTGQWQGKQMVYNRSEWLWVTHWRNLVALPDMLSKEDVEAHIRTLEPDYISEMTPMRALFGGVGPEELELKERLLKAVRRAGTQGIVASRGTVKGQFYIDFTANEALDIREIKQNLDAAGIAYTIRSRKK